MKNLICWLAILFCCGQYSYAQNQVLDFAGDGDQLLITSPVTRSDDFTTELWFNSRNTETFVNLISWGDRGTDYPDRFNVYLFNDRLAIVDDAFGSSLIFPSDIDILPDGSWHHLAISKSGNEISIYHNDIEYSYTTGVSKDYDLLPNLTIGYRAGQSLTGWHGQIDDLRIWNFDRTKAAIDATKNCGINGNEVGLVLYYNFENGLIDANGDGIARHVNDLAGEDHPGLLDGFSYNQTTSNLVTLESDLPFSCGGSQLDCAVKIEPVEQIDCETISVSVTDPNPAYDYLWFFADGNSSTSPSTIHTYTEEGTFNVCLQVSGDDCEAPLFCQTIEISFERPLLFEIEDAFVVVEQDPERGCLGFAQPRIPTIFEACAGIVSIEYFRADGKELDEGYPLGLTEIKTIIDYKLGIDSARSWIVVNESPLCTDDEMLEICSAQCESVTFVNLSTGVDENGNKLPSGIGLTDPYWKLVNKAPAETGCENLLTTINGSAYLNNWVFPDVNTWANLPGVTPIAPVDIGNNGAFGCNNLRNTEGQIVPYIFERDFCICDPGEYNFNFEFKGDDRAFLELWNLTTSQLIATSSTYTYQNLNAASTWQFTESLSTGEYAIRANLANTSSTTLGLAIIGSVSNEGTGLKEIGDCCDPKNINVRSIIDLDCSSSITNGDMPVQGWTYNLINEQGQILVSKETDINGELFFNAIDPGVYTVEQVLQPGYTANVPSTGTVTIVVTENSFNTIEFLNCEAGCFSIESSDIVCNNDLTYEITVKIKNENNQIFDRLLMFSQSNETAVNPTISLDFGEGKGTLAPGEISDSISFTVTQLDYVDQPVDVCFDVIPQNPENEDCCKDQFCITLPVCCPPEETTSCTLNQIDDSEQCCYELVVNNECAEDYYKGLDIVLQTTGWNMTIQNVSDGFVAAGTGVSTILGPDNNNTEERIFFPTGITQLATICLEGQSSDSPITQELQLAWVVCDDVGNNIYLEPTIKTVNCIPPPDECGVISNMFLECSSEDQYVLMFDVQNQSLDQMTAQQIIIAPEGNTSTANYSPQSFDNIDIGFGDTQSFEINISGLSQSESFEFSLSMHDYNNIMPDGNYWCCFNSDIVTIQLDECIGSLTSDNDNDISFQVYPNPVNDQVTILLDKASSTSLQLSLVNLNGEVVDTRKISPETSEYIYSLGDNFPSIYWIKIQDENGQVSYQKIIKL